jgi:hypothetical protein
MATRLTREGRLHEAMAVLRGALTGPPSSVAGDAQPFRVPSRLSVARWRCQCGRTAPPIFQGVSFRQGQRIKEPCRATARGRRVSSPIAPQAPQGWPKITQGHFSRACGTRPSQRARPSVFCGVHCVNASYPCAAVSHCWASLSNNMRCCGSPSCSAARRQSSTKNSQSSFSTVLAMAMLLQRAPSLSPLCWSRPERFIRTSGGKLCRAA